MASLGVEWPPALRRLIDLFGSQNLDLSTATLHVYEEERSATCVGGTVEVTLGSGFVPLPKLQFKLPCREGAVVHLKTEMNNTLRAVPYGFAPALLQMEQLTQYEVIVRDIDAPCACASDPKCQCPAK